MQTLSRTTTERCHRSDCSRKATVIVKGEQDSFGYEEVHLCEQCHARAVGEDEKYFAGRGVEDRPPTPGHVFLVNEMTNHDGHGDWLSIFTSYRKAVGAYRTIEELAAPWGGLYPGKGVREVTKEEGDRLLKLEMEHRARVVDEIEEEELADDFGPEEPDDSDFVVDWRYDLPDDEDV